MCLRILAIKIPQKQFQSQAWPFLLGELAQVLLSICNPQILVGEISKPNTRNPKSIDLSLLLNILKLLDCLSIIQCRIPYLELFLPSVGTTSNSEQKLSETDEPNVEPVSSASDDKQNDEQRSDDKRSDEQRSDEQRSEDSNTSGYKPLILSLYESCCEEDSKTLLKRLYKKLDTIVQPVDQHRLLIQSNSIATMSQLSQAIENLVWGHLLRQFYRTNKLEMDELYRYVLKFSKFRPRNIEDDLMSLPPELWDWADAIDFDSSLAH